MQAEICLATVADAPSVAQMAAELLGEITTRTQLSQAAGPQPFNLERAGDPRLAESLLAAGLYKILLAQKEDEAAGFISLCESQSIYANGIFGIVHELYVRPCLRGHGIGRQLLDAAIAFARARQWQRLEVTTPPLPMFDATLAFYEGCGFAVSGGRKLKLPL